VRTWDTETGKLLQTLNRKRLSHQKSYPFAVTALVYALDGQTLLATGMGGEVHGLITVVMTITASLPGGYCMSFNGSTGVQSLSSARSVGFSIGVEIEGA